jgi:hypothetical protein
MAAMADSNRISNRCATPSRPQRFSACAGITRHVASLSAVSLDTVPL